jgi:hypothetical protein
MTQIVLSFEFENVPVGRRIERTKELLSGTDLPFSIAELDG